MTLRIAGPPSAWDGETGVAIIGGGAAGLTAGLRARELGADVLVLERDRSPAGSTAMSSGFVPASGTRWQREAGIADTPEAFAEDIAAKAHGSNHPGITRTVAGAIAPALEWLADRHGLEWRVLDGFLYPGHRRHRMHAVPETSGEGLMARMINAAEAADVPILTDARAEALAVDGRTILGVGLTRPDGRTEWLRAGKVVLACNGYGGNSALVRELIPEIADAVYHGHAGNTGDAVLWGRGLNARCRDLSAYQGHGNLAHPHGILITWALMMQGGVQVNARGERFSNEHEGYSEQAVKVLSQPGAIAWAVFDARLHEIGLEFPDYRDAVAAGAVSRGSVAALADAMNVPPRVLDATLSHARNCAAGRADDRYGRDFTISPPLGHDLCAIRVTGALFHTQGGLDIDTSARVLHEDGTPFANLYAVGGAACGVSGDRVEGYLSGNGLLTAIALGFVAGAAVTGQERPHG